MKELKELQPLILEWAKEKDLLKADNAPKQRLKLIEECGELASAILKNDVKEQKDAIGDIFVVLVILEGQTSGNLEFDFENLCTTHFNDISDILMDICFTYKPSLELSYINEISLRLNLNLTECANIAWNEIKDRKGKTINGTFIKNEN